MDEYYFEAILADSSYSLPYNRATSNTNSNKNLQKYIDNASSIHPEYASKLHELKIVQTDFDHAILYSEKLDTYYVSIRGTVLSQNNGTILRDLLNDAEITVGIIPHRTGEIFDSIRELRLGSPNSSITVIGHSLGGTIAEYIGKLDHTINIVAFNSGESFLTHIPGINKVSGLIDSIAVHHSNIVNINISGDKISNQSLFNTSGKVINIENVKKDLIELHKMDNFLPHIIHNSDNNGNGGKKTIPKISLNDVIVNMRQKYYVFDDGKSDDIVLIDKTSVSNLNDCVQKGENNLNPDNPKFIDSKKNFDDEFNKQSDNRNIIRNIMKNMDSTITKLEIVHVIKQWGCMTKNQRIHYVIGTGLDISYGNMDPSIRIISNMIKTGRVSAENVSWALIEYYTNIPTGHMGKMFHDICHKGKIKAIIEDGAKIATDLLMIVIPELRIVYQIIAIGGLVKGIFTHHHEHTIKGIQASEIDRITQHGIFNIGHSVTIYNSFFNINVEQFAKSHKTAYNGAEAKFTQQAKIKVYRTIGVPYEFMDPEKPISESRLERYREYKMLKNCQNKWLDVNDKKLSPKERERIDRFYNENEQDRNYRIGNDKNGISTGFYQLHKSDNILKFLQNVVGKFGDIHSLNDFLNIFMDVNYGDGSVKKSVDDQVFKDFQNVKRHQTSKDNDRLETYKNDQQAHNLMGDGEYDRLSIIKFANKELLKYEMSIGNFVNVGTATDICMLTRFLVYIDQEIEMIRRDPSRYTVEKLKQYGLTYTQIFTTQILTSHAITTIGLLPLIDHIPDEVINSIFTPVIGFGISFALAELMCLLQDIERKPIDKVISSINITIRVTYNILYMTKPSELASVMSGTGPVGLGLTKLCKVLGGALTHVLHTLFPMLGGITVTIPPIFLISIVTSLFFVGVFRFIKFLYDRWERGFYGFDNRYISDHCVQYYISDHCSLCYKSDHLTQRYVEDHHSLYYKGDYRMTCYVSDHKTLNYTGTDRPLNNARGKSYPESIPGFVDSINIESSIGVSII